MTTQKIRKTQPPRIELPMLIPAIAEGEPSLFTEQSLKDKLAAWVQTSLVPLDPDKVADGVVKVLNSYSYVLHKASDAITKAGAGFKLDSVEIGISIDAKGSVGVAALGAEASLKITWKR